MGDEFVLPGVEQVAIVVNDLQKSTEFLSLTLGIGPFRFAERSGPVNIDGKVCEGKRRLGIAKMGGIDLEVIEPAPGTPYYDFAMARGEGWQHIRFAPVPDLKQTVAYLTERGFKVRYSGEIGGGFFAYLESDQVKGLVLEFVQRAPRPTS